MRHPLLMTLTAATAASLFVLGCNHPSTIAVPASLVHAAGAVRASPDTPPAAAKNNFVDVSVMARGMCYAGSAKDMQALGGYGPSNNFAQPVSLRSTGKGLYLLAEPEHAMILGNSPGMRLVLVNQTPHTLAFDASDSRLSITQEAMDTDGIWKPIEYLPSSWCGNSYHRVFLEPHHYWQFAVPRYRGVQNTLIRFALSLADGKTVLYSNTFEGSINPTQFTDKQGHTPASIMDPYLE